MNKYLVLGCGPAGLMAVQGIIDGHGGYNMAQQLGVRIAVLSRKRPSQLFGAQYLHAPIPHATEGDPIMVEYTMRGSTDDYRTKVYGNRWDGTVSPEDLPERHEAWDIRATYESLYRRYNHIIYDTEVSPGMLRQVMEDAQFDIVFNSIPREVLCLSELHTFRYTEVIAAGDAPERGVNIRKSTGINIPNGTVVCNGAESPTWYRASHIFGYTTVEWPGSIGEVPVTSAARVRKPTEHNCDCLPGVVHVGRYGTWAKGVLSHEAYGVALNAVQDRISERMPL